MEKISVIIPSYDRPHLAEKLKASILALHPEAEVIIVEGLQNISQARNIGWRQSKGELLFFFDNDVEIIPTTIPAHLTAYSQKDVHAIAGRAINDGEIIPHDTAVETGNTDVLLRSFSSAFWSTKKQSVRFPYGCHFSCRRAAIEAIGGFDESFPNFFDEIDFGLRLTANGQQMLFCPNALVYHHKAPGGGITREKSEVVQQYLYRAYGRMIAKHVPLILQPLSFVLKARHAITHHALKVFVDGYASYYRS